MREFEALGTRKAVLGMVHLPPLPGTPFHQEGSFGQIVDVAVASALALAEGGADGCLVQTVDRVYHPGEDSDENYEALLMATDRLLWASARTRLEVEELLRKRKERTPVRRLSV